MSPGVATWILSQADFENGVFYLKILFILFVQENINSGTAFLEAAPRSGQKESWRRSLRKVRKQIQAVCMKEERKRENTSHNKPNCRVLTLFFSFKGQGKVYVKHVLHDSKKIQESSP